MGKKQRRHSPRILCNPGLIISADEPTSQFGCFFQASVINMLMNYRIKQKYPTCSYPHDMINVGLLAINWGDVSGKLCEYGRTKGIVDPPYHPYTEALLSAIPIADPTIEQKIIRLEGSIPSAINIPPGCRFNSRCPRKIGPICEQEEPSVKKVGENHFICCHIPTDELNRVKPVITRIEPVPTS